MFKAGFLDARDLIACQFVFDELLKEFGLAKDSEEAGRIARRAGWFTPQPLSLAG